MKKKSAFHGKLSFIPQKFNFIVLKIAHLLLPFILRFRTRPWLRGGITTITAERVDELVNGYYQFQSGKIRLILAFRHPETEDPLCLLYLLSRIVPQTAKQMGIKLRSPIHNHFIYDRGMTIWAGNWLGWLFSRGGGIPIHRGKPLDRVALRQGRDLLINGQFPLTIAPEGATNGHSEIVSPLEQGVAQIGFWGMEDLKKANRNESIEIIPISLRYYYHKPPWSALDRLLTQLETDSGLLPQLSSNPTDLYSRLLRLSEHLLLEMEGFYQRFYHVSLPDLSAQNFEIKADYLKARLDRLLTIALRVCEDYFGLSSQGTIIDRCRRLEEAGWNYIYREDIKDLSTLSPLQLGLGNWIAEEAELRLKHMRLVESFVAVSSRYVDPKSSAERFAEILLIFFDVITRIKGTKIPRRPRLGTRWVKIRIGKSISLKTYWQPSQSNRQATKQAIKILTDDLQKALENLII